MVNNRIVVKYVTLNNKGRRGEYARVSQRGKKTKYYKRPKGS